MTMKSGEVWFNNQWAIIEGKGKVLDYSWEFGGVLYVLGMGLIIIFVYLSLNQKKALVWIYGGSQFRNEGYDD